jgi:hypothetical protein
VKAELLPIGLKFSFGAEVFCTTAASDVSNGIESWLFSPHIQYELSKKASDA